MASNHPETVQEKIRERGMSTNPAEPIHSERRTVTTRGSENKSLYANITNRARDIIAVEAGDDIIVHSYRGFLIIEPANDAGGDHSGH